MVSIMTVKDFIGTHSIDEIAESIFNAIPGRDVELDECFNVGTKRMCDYWFGFLQYEFIRSDVCKECDFRYSTYDSRDNYYEWCTYPARGKCAHEKEWRDCVLNKIKKCMEDIFLKELAEQ